MDKIFMNNDALASGIATIISDYRKGDVNHKFDTSHVLKWVDQFDESERNVVLRETFHILSYYYFKEEKIIDILKNFLEKIQNQFSLEKLIFINCQDYVAPKGASQGILLKLIKDIFEKEYDLQCCIKNDNYYDQIGDYIYIDDGLYTGKSAYKDLKNIISQLLPGSQIYVFFIMAYSNGYKYWSQKIKELGQERNIEITFDCNYKLYNDRNCKCECIDIVWPSKESAGISEVRDYENVIRKKGETHYLYYNDINENNSGMFSSFDGLKRIGEIFLKYGIDIVNKANSTKLRPLGFDNLNSFGFGSFCATDYNISNTCPLVLWWGSENGTIESDYPIECWYPLLPRRNNKELYREMIINSEAFSVFDYEGVLFTVYYLAKQRNIPKSKPKCSVSSVIDYADIDYDSEQYYEELFSSDLYQYLNSQKLFTIKVVQTAMYLGRDYNYENSMKRKTAMNNQDFEMSDTHLKNQKSNELFLEYMDYIFFEMDWKYKMDEIEQIYLKPNLDQLIYKALIILEMI